MSFRVPRRTPLCRPSIPNRRIRNSALPPDYNGARMAFSSDKNSGRMKSSQRWALGGMGEVYRGDDTRLGSTVVR